MREKNEEPLIEIEEPERVDRIPLIISLLIQMRIQEIIDEHYTPHGNHQGLSVGWLSVIFMTYIVAEEGHKMVPVREWVTEHQRTLERMTGQEIGEADFSDDRLGDVLRYLSEEQLWVAIEEDVSRQSIRVYGLGVEGPVRLDATVGGVKHDEKSHSLFKRGRNKAGGYEVQFKVMLGVLDPLGMPLASDIVAGSAADDPLYVPIYKRIRQTLGRTGLLYIGDSKMGAIEIRAVIVVGLDNYLNPLPMTGQTPAFLDEQLAKVWAGEIEPVDIFLPEDLPADPTQAPDPELAIASGFEVNRQQEATLEDGQTVTWEERVLIIRSQAFSETKERQFEQKLAQTEADLLALTPPPGRGKRQFKDEERLRQASEAIMQASQTTPFFELTLERQVTIRQVQAYGGNPARSEEKVRYQLHLSRRETVIEQARRRLGWRVYVTNAAPTKLSLSQAVLAYRDQYLAERPFARLKGSLLALLPLYVQRDDHAKGLIHLLTLCLRLLSILEFVVRRSLAEQEETLSGIYDGNPKRTTHRPSAELLLNAFDNISLMTVTHAGQVLYQHLTPLNQTQLRILALLDLSPDIYDALIDTPFILSLPQAHYHLTEALSSI